MNRPSAAPRVPRSDVMERKSVCRYAVRAGARSPLLANRPSTDADKPCPPSPGGGAEYGEMIARLGSIGRTSRSPAIGMKLATDFRSPARSALARGLRIEPSGRPIRSSPVLAQLWSPRPAPPQPRGRGNRADPFAPLLADEPGRVRPAPAMSASAGTRPVCPIHGSLRIPLGHLRRLMH
jgi:hypothetical protein